MPTVHTRASSAPRPPVAPVAARTPPHERLDPLPHPSATHDLLDDPLTLIAMANALHADRPARAADAAATEFDWTSQLSHRRLTDAPGTLRR
ncbi:hypothetical protein [Burkholderia cepacia]|uniref:Uncharacterized protein n=1 Tax=Burkholderia cepacia GG4 TaxID=1009846 RepID=A0A9W3P9V0_BURCE|nr:hypothetical protein GEM_2494 [Burkholderia cepacia GG4]